MLLQTSEEDATHQNTFDAQMPTLYQMTRSWERGRHSKSLHAGGQQTDLREEEY